MASTAPPKKDPVPRLNDTPVQKQKPESIYGEAVQRSNSKSKLGNRSDSANKSVISSTVFSKPNLKKS
jgi:hypothetical protein